jgi:hypothetical protein
MFNHWNFYLFFQKALTSWLVAPHLLTLFVFATREMQLEEDGNPPFP